MSVANLGKLVEVVGGLAEASEGEPVRTGSVGTEEEHQIVVSFHCLRPWVFWAAVVVEEDLDFQR